MNPVLNVGNEVYRKLLKVKHELEVITGRVLSLDDVILYLVNQYESSVRISIKFINLRLKLTKKLKSIQEDPRMYYRDLLRKEKERFDKIEEMCSRYNSVD